MATTTQAAALPKQKTSLRERLDMGSGMLPYYLVAPTIIIIALVAVYPIIDSIRLSLLDNPLIASGAAFVGLRNYIQVLGDPAFKNSVGITVAFSVISVALETLVGFAVALLMNQMFPGRGLVRTAILIPFAFPTIVSGQIWLLMFNAQNGVLTYLMQATHLLAPGDSLLRTPSGLVTASIIIDVWKTTPFMALLLLAGLQVIPNELYEAAGVDGSSRWQQFWTITLPMLRNALLIALMFRLLDALRAFDLFYILTGGGREVQTMALYSYANMFQGTTFDFAPGVAAAVILFIICAVVSIIIVATTRLSQN
ncbi:MAG TPA: sugar ABC transporter permease [Ktedonobacteraceae bacterium]|jgi:ABC-type sugar transport system permease subunit|nr:sugar ABC transporter permease [Ktedonobacteraceae bacterium]